MSLVNSNSIVRDLTPGLNAAFGEYNQKMSKHSDVFDVYKSKMRSEEDLLLSGAGLAAVKSEGSAIQYDSMEQVYVPRYTHVTYANGMVITREALEDGLTVDLMQKQARELRKSLEQTKEVVCANILNRAFNSSYTGADGKELCATDHPTASSDLANELATAADLSEASLEQALTDIRDMRDHRGLRTQIRGMKLIIPSALEFEAHRILKSVQQNDTANNATNAVKDMGMLPSGVVVWDYLTDSDAWFIKTDANDGLKVFNRREMDFGADNDFDTENARFKATMRFAAGWSDPRGIFGTPGAA